MVKRLELLPDSDGYSVEPSAAGTIENKLPGGFAARRRDLENVTKIFTVQWTCDPYKFRYLWNFYREWLDGMDWYDILLVDEINHAEYPLQNYKAMFLPDSVKTVSVNGWTRVFSCQLEGYLDNPYPMSTVYPIAAEESLQVGPAMPLDGFFWGVAAETLELNAFELIAGELKQQIFGATKFSDEFNLADFSLTEGESKTWTFLQTQSSDEFNLMEFSLIEGQMRDQLIAYKNYAPEEISLTRFELIEGSLT